MDFLRRYVFHNFLLKAISLVMAVLIWSAVAREPFVEVAHSVPVEFDRVPDNVMITSATVPQAQVWIRGPQRVVRDVRDSDLHLTIDVGSLGNVVGERRFSLRPSQIHAPHGVEVVQVSPAELSLTFSRR